MLSTRTSLHCLLRVWFVGAAMTTHGMQHLGLLYALEPGLKALYKDSKNLSLARQRYLGHINTHPFMAPILVGFLLSIERLVAMHKMPAQHMPRLIDTTAETLSAIGDSFFSGTLLVLWALISTLFIINNAIWAAVLCSIIMLAFLLIFRICFFFLGLRQGLMALSKLSKLNLINHAVALRMVNAILLALIYGSICAQYTTVFLWTNFFYGVLFVCFGAFLINKTHLSRVLVLGFSFIAFTLFWLNPAIF